MTANSQPTDNKFNLNAIAEAFELIVNGDQKPREVRVLNHQPNPRSSFSCTTSGYFDNAQSLVEAINSLPGTYDGIYITLNPVQADLMARANNRLVEKARNTTKDDEIIRRRWILIDIDPDRAPGISANDTEREFVAGTTHTIISNLTDFGFKDLVLADSGNGCHILIPVDLEISEKTSEQIKRFLGILNQLYSDDKAKVDISVHNPARIARLYGTPACKGDYTKERPHRFSKVLEKPQTFDRNENNQHLARFLESNLDTVLSESVQQASNEVQGNSWLSKFMRKHGIQGAPKKMTGYDEAYLIPCPFNPDHGSNGEVHVGKRHDGKLCFSCKHDSCQGYHWKEYRAKIESLLADIDCNFNLHKRYIYVSKQDMFLDTYTYELIKPIAVNRVHQKEMGNCEETASKKILGHSNSISVNNITWLPIPDRIITEGPLQLANTYRPPVNPPIVGSARIWLQHMKILIPDKNIRKHLLAWIAFNIQYPHIKINHQILLGGAPRIGKDALIQPIIQAVGEHNTVQPLASALSSAFDDWRFGKKLAIIQEVDEFNNAYLENAIKPLCAAPPNTLPINPKGFKCFEVPNVLSMILMTNNKRPMTIKEGNERFLCIWCDCEHLGTEYYNRLYKSLKTEMGAIVHFLKNLDVSNFNPAALPPITAWRAEIAGTSYSAIEMDVLSMIEEQEYPFDNDVIVLAKAAEALNTTTKQLSIILSQQGFSHTELKITDSDRKIRRTRKVWVIRNKDRYKGESHQKIYDIATQKIRPDSLDTFKNIAK